jgi:hypothetical protein
MPVSILESFRHSINDVFGLKEKTDDKLNDIEDTEGEAPSDNQSVPNEPETPSNDEIDGNTQDLETNIATDANNADTDGQSADAPPTEGDSVLNPEEPVQVAGTGDMVPVANENISDDEKVQQLFKDTQNPETDYGLTNPNNIRLFKFKFKNAGIDPAQTMNEVEQKSGLSVDKILQRLTPEQYESYIDKSIKLREKYKFN